MGRRRVENLNNHRLTYRFWKPYYFSWLPDSFLVAFIRARLLARMRSIIFYPAARKTICRVSPSVVLDPRGNRADSVAHLWIQHEFMRRGGYLFFIHRNRCVRRYTWRSNPEYFVRGLFRRCSERKIFARTCCTRRGFTIRIMDHTYGYYMGCNLRSR